MSGDAQPNLKSLTKIAQACNVSVGWLAGGDAQIEKNSKGMVEEGNVTVGPAITRNVPLISFVQAGEWTEVVGQFQIEDAEEFLPVTSSVGARAFALKVVGNSMEPEFREGEIVIVDPDHEAETGSFVVAKINHDEATFKQLIKDGGSVFLRPLNGAYPVMDVTGRDLRIVAGSLTTGYR